MDSSFSSVTRVSLLLRIRDDDPQTRPDAWKDFVARYGPMILRWCVNRKLQPTDAEDGTQDVLVKLARALTTFEYNPEFTFRGWLRRVTENALSDFFRDQRKRVDSPLIAAGVEQLNETEAQDDLVRQIEEAFDLELFERACEIVREQIDTRRFNAWYLTAVEQIPAQEVAQRLTMKVPTVYSSRHQVQKRISEEVQRLEELEADLLVTGRTER